MKPTERKRGAGRIYKQPNCSLYYISYYHNGRRVRESTGTDNFGIARQKLNAKLGQMATGTFVGAHVERVKVKELAEPFFRDQRVNERKGQKHAKRRWENHLEPFFGERRVVDVGTDALNQYVDARMKEGAANATINREMAALRRMFRLGYYAKPQKVASLPKFPRLEERNVRLGFVEPQQYGAIAAHAIQLWLRAIFEIYHTYGWRKKEVLAMRVRHVDFTAGVIRLDVGSTKNKEGREVAMTANVRALLSECATGKNRDDFLFTRKDGKPVKNFRGAWRNLCAAAGVSGLMVHDMRRTAARNLRRAGVAEGVIMKIGGWKTRSMFERYNIVDQRDMREALNKLEQAQSEANCHNFGHNSPETTTEIAPSKSKTVN
jgi:integrase